MTDLKKLFEELFSITVDKLRDFDLEASFSKKISKLKGKELFNLLKKISEILQSDDLTHYKNLRKPLQKYKRVHVNSCYVVLFYDTILKKVIFVDYEHHDKVYKKK